MELETFKTKKFIGFMTGMRQWVIFKDVLKKNGQTITSFFNLVIEKTIAEYEAKKKQNY